MFPEAQVDLAKTCLTYLLFDNLQRDISCNSQTLFRFWRKYPLLDYASRYWARHIRGQTEVTERVLLQKLLQAPHRIECLSRIALLDLHINTPLSAVRTTLQLPSHLFLQTKFTTLHLCAFFGLLSTIEYELANGAQVDQMDSEGRTPLTLAAQNGHDEVVLFFISRSDVDVRSRDNYGRTPLCWAARNGHHSVVELLLSCLSVNVNNQDCLGRTPLYAAAQNGDKAILTLLLSLGVVDVNLRDHEGRTPLLRAFELGLHDVVASLLTRNDIDVNSGDEDNNTPLLQAAKGGDHEFARLLLAHEGIETIHENPAEFALKLDPFLVRLTSNLPYSGRTISRNVNVNCRDNGHRTPLHWAAMSGCDAIVDLLLAHDDIEANPYDAMRLTPFLLAVENGHNATAERLLGHPSVEISSIVECRQMTRLHQAAQRGDDVTVNSLLALEVLLVNMRDTRGQTPLHLAVENGHDGVVDLLLASDAIQVNALDDCGETPLSLESTAGAYNHSNKTASMPIRRCQHSESPTPDTSPLRSRERPRRSSGSSIGI